MDYRYQSNNGGSQNFLQNSPASSNFQSKLSTSSNSICSKHFSEENPVKDRSGRPLPPPTQAFQSVDPVLVDELGNKMAEVKHEFASTVAEHGDVYQKLLEYRAAVDKLNPNPRGGGRGGGTKVPSCLLSAKLLIN